jgi:alpha-L-fucosidase 2
MVFGAVQAERLQLNEGNIWSGNARSDYDRVGAHAHFPEIRRLMAIGKHQEAKALVAREILGERPPGCYQPLGDLSLRFEGVEDAVDYRRELNIDEAVARTSFRAGGAFFIREVFSSAPDQVIVVRFTCDQPGRLSFTADLSREAYAESASSGQCGLVVRGQADRGLSTAGTHFIVRAEVLAEGGEVVSKDGLLRVDQANAVTIIIAAASDYRSEDFEAQCEKQIAAASGRPFAKLREAHLKEHQRLFRRVTIDLGKAPELPTDERLRRFTEGEEDNALIALFVQYGRYLLISSSRPGNLPATLQGLWNESFSPPWFCGWHFDISAPMNYWMAETANLSECHEPFMDLLDAIRVNGRKTAKDVYGCSGFVVAHRTTPWLFTAPVHGLDLWASGAGWCCQHLWEHYQFTHDREFLANKGYPIMKEAAEFFLDWLTPDLLTGQLVSGPSISPENSFACGEGNFAELDMGPAMDQQIADELFDNCLAAGEVLGFEDEFLARVSKARARLADGLKIGSDGRLLEWSTERPEREPGHRHLSHLYAAYPGRAVSLRKTPELAQAACKSLEVRLQYGRKGSNDEAADSGNTGWSLAWSASLWARLGEGEKATAAIKTMISELLLPNLLCTAPWQTPGAFLHVMDESSWQAKGLVFQVDGNFGMSAAIVEMLLQSHAGEIELLPALPEEWSHGQVKGLRTRGPFEVDMTWRSGRLEQATIHAPCGGVCRVRLGEQVAEFLTQPGEIFALDSALGRVAD